MQTIWCSKAARPYRRRTKPSSASDEDIDITYDIREIAGDLVKSPTDEPLPQSRSQAKKWTEAVRARLPNWLNETVLPHLQHRIEASKLNAKASLTEDCIHLEYETQAAGYGYVAPRIKVEFGARSTGEHAQQLPIDCDAAQFLPDLAFQSVTPRVMSVARTAWEKMTAIHVFCLQDNIKNRLGRHWYDIARLDSAGHIATALANKEIALRVAHHKSAFFAAKDSRGTEIDYATAIGGKLLLVPEGSALKALEADYEQMIEDRLFLHDPEPFSWIIERCTDIQNRANAGS